MSNNDNPKLGTQTIKGFTLDVLQDFIRQILNDDEDNVTLDTELIFSIGRPTEQKILKPVAFGVAKRNDGEDVLFLELVPTTTTKLHALGAFLKEQENTDVK